MPEFQHCFIFSYLSGASKEGQKGRGAFKCKREGYALFKASHVQDVKYNPSSHSEFCFFETKVKASMTRNKTYRTKVRLKKNTAEVDGAYCNCKAGSNGYCKHVGAVLYTILDFVESGFQEIPPNKTCTEKPQEWHKPRTQTPKNAPVHFSDILMIHHDYDADKDNKTGKRIQRKREKLAYTACPSYALKVTSDQIYSFCCDLKANSDKSKPMLVDVLEGNDYEPVIVEDLEHKFTKCLVAMDHDYLKEKQKTYLEIKTSTPTEVEHLSPCKKQKLDLIDGNECEPFDSNFSNDSHILISHSVLITPEGNPQGNQEIQLEADCQEEPTAETSSEASQTVKNGNTCFVEIPFKGQVVSDEFDLTNPMFREECQNFLSQIKINNSEAIDVEERTRGQSSNPEWFKYRTGRIPASKFGEVNNRRSTTAPDRLVRDLFQYRARTTTPFQCAEGLRLEPVIKDKYVEYQLNHGHLGLCVEEKGVVIDQDNAFLAASVDGEVHDPSNTGYPVGNLEMKYKLFPEKVDPENNIRLLVTLATKTKNFCLELTDSGLRLKKKHPYYSQVQGGMAIRRMQWCDFVVYTYTSAVEDIHVERIYFDPTFWVALKGKLVDFYLFAMIPELLTTRVKRGIPLYPNIFSYK